MVRQWKKSVRLSEKHHEERIEKGYDGGEKEGAFNDGIAEEGWFIVSTQGCFQFHFFMEKIMARQKMQLNGLQTASFGKIWPRMRLLLSFKMGAGQRRRMAKKQVEAWTFTCHKREFAAR